MYEAQKHQLLLFEFFSTYWSKLWWCASVSATVAHDVQTKGRSACVFVIRIVIQGFRIFGVQ